jgi:cap2 methyltransferase
MLVYDLKNSSFDKTQSLKTVLQELYILKKRLNKAKHQLDVGFCSKGFIKKWRALDPFKYAKHKISKMYKIPHVTNATLKAIELFKYFDLIQEGLHFDNAALPGSFIIVYKYLCKKANIKPHWVASSLLEGKDAINDQFHLVRDFPNQWLMHENNNGDVCMITNQLDWKERLQGQVSLYVSDLGFQTGYDNQEEEHQQANIGQIVCGLNTLSPGGNMVIKMYTAFTHWSIYLLWMLKESFEECYWCKPETSRMANSETYVVCKGYNGCSMNPEDLLNIQTPTNDIPKEFLALINHYNHELFIQQIHTLNHQVQAAWESEIPDHKSIINQWLKKYMSS